MIEVRGLTKRWGAKTAVDDLTFTVQPGIVTGFLGPNGAGKSTTMRVIIGLDAPSSGKATVGGRRYRDWPAPLHEVGALLEAGSLHPGRSAYKHLLALALTHGIPRRRVDEVIGLAGLGEVAHKRAAGFSLGMGQRLGIASAPRPHHRRAAQPGHPAPRSLGPGPCGQLDRVPATCQGLELL
jgi:ABC-2 type transport system ATP-binding protein